MMERPQPTLLAPGDTIKVLQKYGFSFQKKYGQNFLIDTHVTDKIMRAADIAEDDFVVEIGPGIGTLTQQLAYRAGRVYAVEIDRKLMPVLEDTLSGYNNVTLVNDDIMKVDLREVAASMNGGKKMKVVANLPYYITTPVIMSLFENNVPLDSAVVMVQKEVADRMRALPGTGDYGAITLAVQYYSEVELVANVPPNCFMPRPKVGSAVVALKCRALPELKQDGRERMFRIIRASFEQRRKTLANSLYNAEGLEIPKNVTEAALREMGLGKSERGERLSLEQFMQLTLLIDEMMG